jgi:CRISPR-associated protein Csh1
MFHRLYELSRSLPEREPWQRLNEGMPAQYDRGLAICFDRQGEWSSVKTVSGNQGVVYRSGPPNGTDLTSCCKLASNTPNRLLRAAKNLADCDGLVSEKRAWLGSSIASFERNKDDIWAEVQAKRGQAGVDDKEHRGYVYWAQDPDIKPLYAWPEAKDFLVQQFLAPFAKGGTRKGQCSVCGRSNLTVYGNFSVLACYNLDKPGSIAGGFKPVQAHRNLPVCGDCTLALADAATFAETYLSSNMAGQSYMILPYANAPSVREELYHSLREHPDRYRLSKAHDLVGEELELMGEFAGYGDQLAFALIFFKSDQAAWRIQAEVQQLLPSRMQALHKAIKNITRADDLASEDKKNSKPLHITAMTFKTFSGTAQEVSADTLRAWLVALFEHRLIDYKNFLHHLVSKLISTGKSKPEFLHWMTRQAWGLYRYAMLTDLITQNEAKEQPSMQEAIPDSAYGRYVETHRDFFNRPELVAAFLSGCYASLVASVQRQERGADPFTKKFIGRLLSRQQLRRLYREGHDKLAQYGKLGYVVKTLDPDLATAWVACEDRWTINDEEATFAFTIGYSLAYRIQQIDSQDDNQDPE